MSLLLAPYNNAMRLGQGFNSYTHEICIDDAVVISPQQEENILTNDCNTMRLTAMILDKPSAWTKQDQVLLDVSRFQGAQEQRAAIEREKAGTQNSAASKASEAPATVSAVAKSDKGDIEASNEEQELNVQALSPAGEASEEFETIEPLADIEPKETATGDDGEVPAAETGTTASEPTGDSGSPSDPAPVDTPDKPEAAPGFADDGQPSENGAAETEDPEKDNPAEDSPNKDSEADDETSEKVKSGLAADEHSETSPGNEAVTQPKNSLDPAKSQKDAAPSPQDLKNKEAELKRAEQRRRRDPEMAAAAEKFKVNLSLDQMAAMHKEFLLPKSKNKAPGIGSQTQVFNIKNSTGVSQTVVYQSRFVDKLSEITSDLGVSAALSVKTGSVGGSGRGSFIDTDKYQSSDMNYYISVKVINQSINFKDALEFNPLDNVDASDFRAVFGDSFISGFLEGGELNALVSMKILNTAKSRDIQAEGAIALGKGSLNIDGSGAFKSAKANLELNTETTIQVSWIGGGMIKPPEEAWTVDSLARAATRFPDHVAQSPQRTHAIFTKYETLRSYQALKPPAVTPIDYKNAAAYTNELLNTFMSYKAMYGRLTSQINDVQSGLLKFKKIEGEASKKENQVKILTAVSERPLESLNDDEKKARVGFFPSSLDGLDDARRATRDQMNLIIGRVDDITKNPNLVLDSPKEKFLPPFAFETLLPVLESAFRSNKRTAPLTGEQMFGGPAEDESSTAVACRMCFVRKPEAKKDVGDNGTKKVEDGKDKTAETKAEADGRSVILLSQESKAIAKYLASRDDGIEDSLRLTPPLGSEKSSPPPGTAFTALDFVQPTFLIESVRITLTDGVVSGLACRYANGMSWKRGLTDPKTTYSLDLQPNERITSAIVTVGTEAVLKSPESILSLKLVTNSGRSLIAEEKNVRRGGFNRRFIGKRAFFDVRAITFESPLERGYLVGFWGWSAEQGSNPGLFRLGVVWANKNSADVKLAPDVKKEKAEETDASKEERVGNSEKLAAELEDKKKDLGLAQADNERLKTEVETNQKKIEEATQYKKSIAWFEDHHLESFVLESFSAKGEGLLLSHRESDDGAILSRPNEKWNQTWRVARTERGFKIYTQNKEGKKWYLAIDGSQADLEDETGDRPGCLLSREDPTNSDFVFVPQDGA
ncbi:hypothetical protein V8E36_007756 [Tilletia maclaganii]